MPRFSLVFGLLILCLRAEASRHKAAIDPASLLPSSSLMHPLDFQDDWQASEPVPVDIFYTVPVNGESDLRKALERANDAALLFAERKRQMKREMQNKEFIGSQISMILNDARRALRPARKESKWPRSTY